MSLKPINHYSLTNPASVYDEEALTALELAGRTAAKVNESVEAFNKLEKETNDHLSEQDAAIKEMNDVTMPAKVDAEVNEHINNGDFDEQISEYAGQLSARVDNLLGKVTEGTSTMDAEIIDARMDNYNYTRANIGASIRAQIFDVFSLENATALLGWGNKINIVYHRDGNGGADLTFDKAYIDLRVPNSSTVTEYIYLDTTLSEHVSEITANVTKNADGTFTVYLPTHTGLAYNVNDKKLHIRQQNRQVYGDIMLIFNAFARICGGALFNEHIAKEIETLKSNGIDKLSGDMRSFLRSVNWYFYIGYGNRPLVNTEIVPGTGELIVQLPTSLDYINYETRGTILLSASTIAEYTYNNYIVENTDSITRIKMPPNSVLTFDVNLQKFGVINASSITYSTCVLLVNNWGYLSEGMLLPFIHGQRLDRLEADVKYIAARGDTVTLGRSADVAALLNTDHRVDTFLFATDLHPVYKGAEWWQTVSDYVQHIKKRDELLPLDFVLTGGDWLNNATTRIEATHALGLIYGKMRAAFGDRGHLILGNHDNNYQGKANETSEANTGALTQTVVNNLWYKDRGGKSYYDFTTTNARYFVFDSGCDWYPDIDTYKDAQIKYFGETLKTNDKPFIVLTSHMVDVGSQNYSPFISKICEIADAFNKRTTITYNSVTYDFSGATGSVKLLIGGHTHADETGSLHSIPFVLTRNYSDGQSFDYFVVDYDAGVVSLIREGNGTDRSLTI